MNVITKLAGLLRGDAPDTTTAEPPERMDLHSGLPYWLVRNGTGMPFPEVDGDIDTEVLIVGGGITGALCAYHLMEAGVACTVVDARSIGTGSTCASTALLQYEIDTPLHELVRLVGESNAVRAYQASAESVFALLGLSRSLAVSDTHQRKSVQYASRNSHVADLKKEAALRNANGLPVDLLFGEETLTALPFAAPAAIRCHIAAETDAWRLTHALHERSQRLGARIFERTAVVDFRDNGSGIRLLTANGHTLRARHLIYATGYESRSLLPDDVITLNSTYALVSEARTVDVPWPERSLIWETAQPYLYLRTAPEGRIIMGGRDEPFRSPRLRDALLPKKTVALTEDFHRLIPQRPMRAEYAWCGTFGATKDGLPYIDRHPRDRNSWFALGMGGNGITFSVIAAEILRDRITGRRNAHADLFRFDR